MFAIICLNIMLLISCWYLIAENQKNKNKINDLQDDLITSEKKFHSFPGMKHVQAERKYREQYWKIVGEFLKKHFE